MGLPKGFSKGFRKDLKLYPEHFGPRRREEMVTEDIAKGGTYLPRGVMYEDLDKTFIEFVNEDLQIVIDGEKVPVIFLTIQRWAEFARTWKFTDEFKDMQMPFITVVRKPDVQVGTNQKSLWNIPGHHTYAYMKVPTWNGGRAGVDTYRVPQPTSVDMTYEVRLFCNRMRELNKFNVKIQETFQSRQFYISPNGHPMPVHLESIGDESPIDDFENRRFYVQMFEMKLLGYIINEEDFKVVPSIDRTMVMVELCEPTKPIVKTTVCEAQATINLNIVCKPFAQNYFEMIHNYHALFNTFVPIQGITNPIYRIDNVVTAFPFEINAGQTLRIDFTKNQQITGKFRLTGIIL
jgi:hypothetical protein